MKVKKICCYILGILMVVGGLFCVFNPKATFLTIGYVIGITMLLDAIGNIYNWFQLSKEKQADGWQLASGIISLVFGIIIISDLQAQLSVDIVVAYLAAIWFVLRGITAIIISLKVRKFHKNFETEVLGSKWWHRTITGILLILFGIISIAHPAVIATYIGIFIGLGIIACGADLITIGGSL